MTVQGGVKAGKISKPYGLQGEVHIILIPVVAQKMKPGSPLFIDLDGQRVPFFIELVNLVADDQAIVKLEFINSVEEARNVSGCHVYLDLEQVTDANQTDNELAGVIGYRAIDDKLGDLGEVVDLIPSEMNPVWVIDHGGEEIIIPATEDFIQKIDRKNNSLHLDLPEGITEL